MPLTANHEKISYVAPSEVHPYLDFIQVMTYDFRGPADNETGHHTPLYPRADDVDQKLNVAAAVEEYVQVYQVPENKLIVGMGYYSRGWTGVDSVSVGTSATGPAIGAWDDPNEPSGLNPWFLLKEMEQSPENIVNWDDESKIPYLYNPITNEFFTYENLRSIQYKVDYIFEHHLGGAMVRDLSHDTVNNDLGSIVATILDDDNYPIPESTPTTDFQFIIRPNEIGSITNYSGSSSDVIIPSVVTQGGIEYTITNIERQAFQNKNSTFGAAEQGCII